MTDRQTDGQIGPYLLPRLAELTSGKKFTVAFGNLRIGGEVT